MGGIAQSVLWYCPRRNCAIEGWPGIQPYVATLQVLTTRYQPRRNRISGETDHIVKSARCKGTVFHNGIGVEDDLLVR
jgi:hypothetical protein